MAQAVTTIIDAFTEFAAQSPYAVWITMATDRVSMTGWGDLYEQGIAFLAMHLMTRAGLSTDSSSGGSGGGAGGSGVTAEKAGDVSRSYGSLSMYQTTQGDADLMGTKFGRMFLGLRAMLYTTAPSVVNPATEQTEVAAQDD